MNCQNGLTLNQKEFIFTREVPFESCHASTLVVLPGGQIMSAWFGGSQEGAGDVAIWGSWRENGQWSQPVKVADRDDLPHWNPVLFRDRENKIYLFYKVGWEIPDWRTRVMVSQDGKNWSDPRPLVPGDRGGRGPVKNKPLIREDGTWLAPASLETEDRWDAFVDLSRDRGETWQKSELVPLQRADQKEAETKESVVVEGKGVIQPTLWTSGPKTVHMLLRSTEGRVFRSDSRDGGWTWSMAYPVEVPNNNSGLDAVQTRDGNLILVCNPVEKNWGPRSPLTIFLSTDNGTGWQRIMDLEEGAGEYSYPSAVIEDKTIHLTYTYDRARIVYVGLKLHI